MTGSEDAPGPGEAPADATLRRYRPADREAVWRLHERALRDAGTDPDDVPGTDDLDRIEETYLRDGDFLVVEVPRTSGGASGERSEPRAVEPPRDGDVVAMGGIRVAGDEAEVHRMRVAPEHQREGYGSLVLGGLERAARERGASRVVLTTAANQTAATRFYPARGYEETGRRREGGYELVRFEKRLSGEE